MRSYYDRLSFLYRLEYLHHAYRENNESVPRAQIQLMERLPERGRPQRRPRQKQAYGHRKSAPECPA